MGGGDAQGSPCELLAWAASGAMALTGWPDGPPLAPGAPVATRLLGVVDEVARRSVADGTRVDMDLATVLSARAAALGLSRRGRTSASGSCRLLPAGAHWIAWNLARAEDIEAVPAILGRYGRQLPDPWDALAGSLAHAPLPVVDEIIGRARLLGVPVARLASPASTLPFPCGLADSGRADTGHPDTGRPGTGRPGTGPPDTGLADTRRADTGRADSWRADTGRADSWRADTGLADSRRADTELGDPDLADWDPADCWSVRRIAERQAPAVLADCRVIDLSSLWAGPLVARILAAAGANIVKVESASRPDGARRGPMSWFRWLHAGAEEVSLDFSTATGRHELRRLLGSADVVIEASRPRALAQLCAGPSQIAGRPGVVWLSITGHGREGPAATWTGFGDDAAVAGGLVAWDAGSPVFCADAIADPATGLVGALAVLRARAAGGGVLVDLPLSRVAERLGRPSSARCPGHHGIDRIDGQWTVRCGQISATVRDPAGLSS